jgi:hypothetical protein
MAAGSSDGPKSLATAHVIAAAFEEGGHGVISSNGALLAPTVAHRQRHPACHGFKPPDDI